MRSRYQHDGSVDFHAESEHEILRRAEEALERQRSAQHAALPLGTPGALSNPPIALGATATRGRTVASVISPPAMPHEEIAARLAIQPPSIVATPSWPSPSATTGIARNHSRRR